MPDTHNTPPRPRAAVDLEAAMEQRRVKLRMSWRDVSVAAGMSYEGLRAIRKGERHPNPVTKGRIEDALQWTPGSVDTVLAGGEPTPVVTEPRPQYNVDELRDLRAQLNSIIDRIEEIQRRRG